MYKHKIITDYFEKHNSSYSMMI